MITAPTCQQSTAWFRWLDGAGEAHAERVAEPLEEVNSDSDSSIASVESGGGNLPERVELEEPLCVPVSSLFWCTGNGSDGPQCFRGCACVNEDDIMLRGRPTSSNFKAYQSCRALSFGKLPAPQVLSKSEGLT